MTRSILMIVPMKKCPISVGYTRLPFEDDCIDHSDVNDDDDASGKANDDLAEVGKLLKNDTIGKGSFFCTSSIRSHDLSLEIDSSSDGEDGDDSDDLDKDSNEATSRQPPEQIRTGNVSTTFLAIIIIIIMCSDRKRS
jgi:hypothetical protein